MEDQTPNIASEQQSTVPSTPIPASSHSPHTSPWIILFLLLIFPPVAIYFIYREKRYHSWFAYILFFYAIMQLLLFEYQAMFVYPQLAVLYKNLNLSQPTTNMYSSIVFLSILSISEIFAGIILLRKTKEPVESYKMFLNVIVVVLVFGFLYGVIASMYSFILPIYNLTNSIK